MQLARIFPRCFARERFSERWHRRPRPRRWWRRLRRHAAHDEAARGRFRFVCKLSGRDVDPEAVQALSSVRAPGIGTRARASLMSRARIGLHAATQLLSIAHAHEALTSLRLGRAQADIIFDGKAPTTVSKMNQTAIYDALEKWLEVADLQGVLLEMQNILA